MSAIPGFGHWRAASGTGGVAEVGRGLFVGLPQSDGSILSFPTSGRNRAQLSTFLATTSVRAGLTVAAKTIDNFLEKASRLYEQECSCGLSRTST